MIICFTGSIMIVIGRPLLVERSVPLGLSLLRACFKENSSLHISIAKAGLQFLNYLFNEKILFIQPNFRMTFFVTAQTAFHNCTFRFITAHFVHHCTLKQALPLLTVMFIYVFASVTV